MTICRIRKQLRAEALEREGIELGVLVKAQAASRASRRADRTTTKTGACHPAQRSRGLRVRRGDLQKRDQGAALCVSDGWEERDHRTQIDAAKGNRRRGQSAKPDRPSEAW